jgi:SAM-dependent methyltransferase
MHGNSRLLFAKHALPYFRGARRVLEIGPDGVPSAYQQAVGDPSIAWDTVDLADSPNRDRVTFRSSSEYQFPVEDGRYDVVLSGQVIEHVRKVWVWIREVARVCRPGGIVITVNPINWPYHEGPVDCWRIYPEGMRALYEEAGLTVEHAGFEQLDHGPTLVRFHPRVDPVVDELRQIARRMLGRPWWPLGQFHANQAVDGITIGKKSAGSAPPPST